MGEVFDRLYTRFLVRDLAGKIAPSALLVSLVAPLWFGLPEITKFGIAINLYSILLIFPTLWATGFMLQVASVWMGFGFEVGHLPGSKAISDVETFFKTCSSELLIRYERAIAAKEVCNNFAAALVLGFIANMLFFVAHQLDGSNQFPYNLATFRSLFTLVLWVLAVANLRVQVGNSEHLQLKIEGLAPGREPA